MSAETIRRAAAAIRVRAEAARDDSPDQRWTALPALDPDNNGWVVASDIPEADWDTTVARLPYDYDGKAAHHLAAWDPATALALADLLDAGADEIERRVERHGEDVLRHANAAFHAMTAVALTYLGEGS